MLGRVVGRLPTLLGGAGGWGGFGVVGVVPPTLPLLTRGREARWLALGRWCAVAHPTMGGCAMRCAMNAHPTGGGVEPHPTGSVVSSPRRRGSMDSRKGGSPLSRG